jgi:DNA-binding MarR family transcriptional regulator
MSSSNAASIVGPSIDVLDAVLYLDRKQIVEAGGVRLHPSETHQLMCALDGMNFTALAKRFGISKGAVSQVFSRLAAKGVVVIAKDPSRKNAARVTLTPLGEALHVQIVALRCRLADELSARLEDYSDAELAVVARFVGDLRAYVDESLINLSSTGGPR